MSTQTMLIIFAVVVVIAIIALAAFAISSRRTTGGQRPSAPPAARSQAPVAPPVQAPVAPPPAKPVPPERVASPVSEEIEELVRPKLAPYSDLRRVKIDFGTAPDGTLEVWLGKAHYNSVDAIPDQRLRQAVQEAVKEWNQRKEV